MPTMPDSDARHNISVLASGLVKTFSQGRVSVLQGLDYTARFGEISAVIGANGSGKTTLLKILFGLLPADAGQVRTLDLEPLRQWQPLRARAAYVPQQQALDPEITGIETLSFFCALYGLRGASRQSRVDELVQGMGLTEVARRHVAEYSGGLRQRLHLAIGLIHEPRLLLLDEPSTGLDPQGRLFLWETLRAHVRRGNSATVVTHDLEEVTRHADRAALISHGRIRIDAPPAEIIAEHGRSVLELTVRTPPEDWAVIRRRLESLDGIDGITTDGRRAKLHLHDRPRIEADVFAGLYAAGLELESYRREPASLSSAYFRLTGQTLTTATPRGKRR